MKRHRSQPMTGECQLQTYQEETYQTVLNSRTVMVEPTECVKERDIRQLLKHLLTALTGQHVR